MKLQAGWNWGGRCQSPYRQEDDRIPEEGSNSSREQVKPHSAQLVPLLLIAGSMARGFSLR